MGQQMEEKKYPAPTAAKFAVAPFAVMLPFDLLAHLGPTGLFVGACLSYAAYKHGPELYDMARDTLPFLPALAQSSGQSEPGDEKLTEPPPTNTPGKRSMVDRMFGVKPVEPEQVAGQSDQQGKDGFVTVNRSTEVPGIPRYTVEEIVSHIQPNSYQLYIGRSLTLPTHPAISIGFYRRHLKVIGASQKGKSSMAAALLEIMLKTHDPAHLLVAILDKEDRTGKLFTNDPHIVKVRFDDGRIEQLHSRSNEQVLEHLELLQQILELRSHMSVTEIQSQPLIVIYLEEFLRLKKELKARAAKLKGPAKEQALADYERFVFCVNSIAGLGLKLNMQFLICAQVDYRDDDLYEAFANITAGFCFCVKATAAYSAGFLQAELLNQNAKNNQPGQCVAETPDGHDLILAPEYPLEQKILALETSERAIYKNPAPANEGIPIYRSENEPVNGSTSSPRGGGENAHLHLQGNDGNEDSERESREDAPVNVNVNEETRDIIRRMNKMGGIPHGKIAAAVGLDGRKYPIYQKVCRELGIEIKREA